MIDPAVDVAGVSVSRGARSVLRDVTFAVARGERVAILGPNGAGKTTLLKSLNRILKVESGRIRIDGAPLERYSQSELARRLAYVPQADGRSTPFTVRQFVEMARYPHLGPLAPVRESDRAAVARALDATGMRSFAERAMDALSGGERQKAYLAAALAQETQTLLLDEPTAFLDPPRQTEIFRTVGRLHAERACTILFVTHDVNEALAHASRAVALREGRVVFDGPVETLAQTSTLRTIYAHDFAVGPHPRTGRAVVFP